MNIYKASKLQQFVAVLAKQADSIKEQIINVQNNRSISNAVGAQLQQIKDLLTISFTGTDEELRERIDLELLFNNSGGEFDVITQAIELVFDTTDYIYTELSGGRVRIHIQSDIDLTQSNSQKIFGLFTAGVEVEITQNDTTPFAFAGAIGAGFEEGYFSPVEVK